MAIYHFDIMKHLGLFKDFKETKLISIQNITNYYKYPMSHFL